MQTIVDFSTAWPGTAAETLRGLLASPASVNIERPILSLIREAGELTDGGFGEGDITVSVLGDGETSVKPTEIVSEVGEKALTQGSGLLVASFRPDVRAICDKFLMRFPNVLYVPLALYSPAMSGENGNVSMKAVSADQMPLLGEAADTLASVLSSTGGRVRKSDVRGILSRQDPKFDKSAIGPASQTGFVTMVVSEMLRRKQVGLEATRDNDVNPWIVLSEGRRAAAPAAPQAQIKSTVVNLEESPRRVSEDLIQELRDASLGPFQDVRTNIYNKMAHIVEQNSGEPLLVRDLIKRSVAAAREELDGHLADRGKPYPWSRVRVFLTKLLSAREVIIPVGFEQPTALVWTAADGTVAKLTDDFRASLDSVLLVYLLRGGRTLWLDQLAELAGALFNSRRDDAIDESMALVAYSVRDGLVRTTAHSEIQIEACVEPS